MPLINIYKNDIPNDLVFEKSISIDLSLNENIYEYGDYFIENINKYKISTIQIANQNNECYIIQMDKYECPNLKILLENENIQKIFIFARCDMVILKYYLDINVNNVYCIKIAKSLVKYMRLKNFTILCNEYLNINLKNNLISLPNGEKLSSSVLYIHKIKNVIDKTCVKNDEKEIYAYFNLLSVRVKLDLNRMCNIDPFSYEWNF